METKIISDTELISETGKDKLPVSALLALAMTGFLALLTEVFPAGLLTQISRDMNVSESMAGQLVSLYAIGSLISAIPLTAATRGWNRRPLLITALGGFLVFNIITAFSTNYILTLGVRFLAGMAGGLIWGMLAGYARRLVVDKLKGRAMAIAMVGAPLALSFGVPAGTYLGSLIGWRNTFIVMAAIALLLILWVLFKVPDFRGQDQQNQISVKKVFLIPGLRSVLAVIAAWIMAHSILYTYIVPFLGQSGLDSKIDLVLLVFGLFALVGIWLAGLFVDKMLRALVLFSLLIFLLAALVLAMAGESSIAVYFAIAVWGYTFGGAATLVQTAAADTAGENADVAQSMVVTVWNLAIAAGGILGGILLTSGAGNLAWTAFAFTFAGLLIAMGARKYGFTPGPRVSQQKQ
ncbi:MFS transporter [Pseudoflavitalea sp. G-6-1-2]|uniref:MFS transporter n=1 Tax=Pseudoflavitalea sp. G-6-1-2 TaxID=2728841 RepID=UPI00146AC5F8|nr:MFS transporter [Pseudoflavitalea sp. G-6-1-2]NML22608.1 MFS transporter [Pseudoflavitalea sp. G-6-1-2]